MLISRPVFNDKTMHHTCEFFMPNDARSNLLVEVGGARGVGDFLQLRKGANVHATE